jgi:hypothetical protein
MKRAVVLSVVCLIFASVSAFPSPLVREQQVIVDASRASSFGLLGTNDKNMKFWTPTADDVDFVLDRLCNGFMVSSFREHAPILAHFAEYRVQVIGYVKDGHRFLYCNFFRNVDKEDRYPDWKQTEVVVSDGGWSFWRCHYDLTGKKLAQLEINGEA